MSGVPFIDPKPHPNEVNISTSLLLLNHAGLMSLTVSSLAFSAFVTAHAANRNVEEKNKGLFKPLAFGACAFSVGNSLWTMFAVASTWKSNMQIKNPVFGHVGFSLVFILALFLFALALWTLVIEST